MACAVRRRASGDDIRRYGGNTSCVVARRRPASTRCCSISAPGCATSAAAMPDDQPFQGTCLLSHLHWDHVQGLPFFTPLLRAGRRASTSTPRRRRTAGRCDDDRRLDHPPAVVPGPRRPAAGRGSLPRHRRRRLRGRRRQGDGPPGAARRTDARLPRRLAGRSVAYISDHQQPLDGSTRPSPDGARSWSEGVDLLIHDAQYTPRSSLSKATWGHCTIDYAVWLAGQAGVRQLALFHHDPSRTDDDLDELLGCAAAGGARCGVDVFAASEGLVVELA